MSDIPDSGSFNLGLANIASQNYGPTATANQANTAASTAQTQQQTQAAAMQNKLMAARMPLILSQLHDESVGSGDQSGVGGNAPGGGAGSAPRTPGEDIASEDKSAVASDQNFYQPDENDAALRSQYFVPQYTPQEMAHCVARIW